MNLLARLFVVGAGLLAMAGSSRASDLAPAGQPPATIIPATGPRTMIPAGRHEAFRAYCTTGAGARAFARLREDLDRDFLVRPLPADPLTYGDPTPARRTSEQVDRWRDVQDLCGLVSGVAEAATLCWIVTGEERYLTKAREYLVGACRWRLDPDWRSGPVPGATDIEYNDEGHFRLWRKLPLVYDQIRGQLSPEERRLVLAHFAARGTRSAAWIEREGNISQVRRNSIEADLSSHPVRFMPMTGLAGLALWDDLPEARTWWAFAERFYRDQFPPFGGDDGGWAEGVAYWRGTIEHATFQDALLALGDPGAYASPFWRNSPYFCVYNVQPYLATSFGDLSNAGKFNFESATAEYLLHVARVQGDGWLRAYAELCADTRPTPAEAGLRGLDRRYPTAAEFLVRNFIASDRPLPARRSLAGLPPVRWFRDVGWVSMHTALGRPEDDIHVTFVSSPFGSFSHSHAHQNGFVLNAYGAGLAINSGFREWHNSPHHEQWVRQTRSKNALLIDGVGQQPKSKAAKGRILRVDEQPRYTWTTGDATAAYAAAQPPGRVRSVLRDLVLVDGRYLVVRDQVKLAGTGRISWLLHTERELVWQADAARAFTRNGPAALTTKLAGPPTWEATVTTGFPVAVDPKYVTPGQINYPSSGEWNLQQYHLEARTPAAAEHLIYAVLWPEKGGTAPAALDTAVLGDGTLVVKRPDGRTDRLRFSADSLVLE
jgi:hypothetical protein